MTDFNNSTNTDTSSQFNLKKVTAIYFKKWLWFALSALLCLAIAFVWLRYTTPEYLASAKIMLLEENESSSAGAVFNDLPLFSENQEAQITDEIEVITSRRFLQNVVKDLKLNIQYFVIGRIQESEIYKNPPITINFIAADSVINETNFNFYIDINSDKDFAFRIGEDDDPKKVAFGEKIPTTFGGMIITPNLASHFDHAIGNTIHVKMTPTRNIAASLRDRLDVYQNGTGSSKILNVEIQDPIAQKAKDIINALIQQYNESTIELKNLKSKNTADFINERVELIASDLVNVDDSIVRFKTGNKVTDVASEADQFLSSSVQNEQELETAKNQLRLLNYMNESLQDSDQSIPANLGMGDPAISSLSARYNELLSNRDRLLQSAGERNPVVLELNQSLNDIKQNLSNSIKNSTQSLNISINSLENQSNRLNSRIFSVPGQERKLRSIERKQGIKESLYLYLLQKREEATISLTATSPSAKIIDDAYSTGSPVSPNKKMIYFAALFLGLFIPFSIIYVGDLLDTKIHNKEDLEQTIKNITILGEIPKIKAKSASSLIERNDRSLLSESFRIIRTNFDYVRRGRTVQDYDNVVFVTSTINGEGKSFFSMNFALTLANTDKRVLIIGADIRNPKIPEDIKKQHTAKKSSIGLTEYLIDKSVVIGEVINSYEINGNKIDVLLSGKVPPNPAELLMNERMKTLFDTVSGQYDYVIVDTAPAMLVTDTLLFSQYAGHTVYLTRANYTEKRIMNFAKELDTNKKLNGMMLVVNDVKEANFGYGARYGYGLQGKKSFFSRFKS